LFQGVKNKLHVAKKLCIELNISMNELAYIGDDLNDINLLENVGFSATTNNAPCYIKEKVDFVTSKDGGNGAFREFVEELIGESKLLELISN